MSKNTVLGIRIRELREEAGLSMQQLAKKIGVSDAAVCKWENGSSEPKASYILKLAEYFDCSTDYIVGKESGLDGYVNAAVRADIKPNATRPRIKVTDGKGAIVPLAHDSGSVMLDDGERELLGTYRELSPDLKTLLKETVNAWNTANKPAGKKRTNE